MTDITIRLTPSEARATRRAVESSRSFYLDQLRSGITGQRIPGEEPVDYRERAAELLTISQTLTVLIVGGRQPEPQETA
jgi:hypothetical protein